MTADRRAIASAAGDVGVDRGLAIFEDRDVSDQGERFDLLLDFDGLVALGVPVEIGEGGALKGANPLECRAPDVFFDRMASQDLDELVSFGKDQDFRGARVEWMMAHSSLTSGNLLPAMVGVTEETIRVRYGETDQMGHAYYANYLYWFEQARGAWCRERGFSYKSLEAEDIFLPVVEVHARYRGEVKYDDVVTVRVRVTETKRAAIKFEYEVFNEGRLVTEGYTWHVVMNPHLRKAMSIPDSLREKLERTPI